jgi:hypothetical protein
MSPGADPYRLPASRQREVRPWCLAVFVYCLAEPAATEALFGLEGRLGVWARPRGEHGRLAW